VLRSEATEGTRTLDLTFTKRLLCHLSYGGDLKKPLLGVAHYTSVDTEMQGKSI
jgi:hypothetical protein